MDFTPHQSHHEEVPDMDMQPPRVAKREILSDQQEFEVAAKDYFYKVGKLTGPVRVGVMRDQYMVPEAALKDKYPDGSKVYWEAGSVTVSGYTIYFVYKREYWPPGQYEKRPLGILERSTLGD